MKNFKDFIVNEKKKDINSLTFNDLVDYTSNSDNTITKGRFCIGSEGKKFHEDVWKPEWIKLYEDFVDAYEDAGGEIEEENHKGGMYEIYCNYEGKSKAAQYILLNFFRSIYGQFAIK